MNINIKDFLFKYPPDTSRGLICNSLIFLALSILIFQWVILYLVSSDNYYLYWLVCSSLYAIYFIWWIRRNIIYMHWSNKLKVIFAVTIGVDNEKLKNEYFNLINNFKEGLKNYKLTKYIKVYIKPIDTCFSDHEKAEKKVKLNELCSTMIISGVPINAGKEVEFKLNFHYEFRYPGNREKENYFKKIFGAKVLKGMVNKNWLIKGDIQSKKDICYSLVNTVTYILALCSASIGRSNLAMKLLQPTIDECNLNKSRKEYGPLIEEIRNYIFAINNIHFILKYWDLKLDDLKPLALEMQRIRKYDYSTLMAMAIVSELEGNRKDAWEYTNEAENNHPIKIYDYKFNYLYFYLTEGDYDEAFKVLDELINDGIERDVKYILNFLYDKYDKKKDLAILFDIGVVSYLWGDNKLGRRELIKFTNNASKNIKYNELVKKVNELITKK